MLYLLYYIVALVLLKLYLTVTAGVCRSKKRLDGKVAIITGANTGIGFETAKDLAGRGAKVILACRNVEKGEEAVKSIIDSTGNQNVCTKELDLSSFKSIRKFAENVKSSEESVDILVHNAGMTTTGEEKRVFLTEDGLEVQFATNYFGPFLLTYLILPKMHQAGRIVVVSSIAHWLASLDLDNLNSEKGFRHPFLVYSSTKLANILFTRELSRRLRGTGITVNCCHPGGVKTGIARNGDFLIKRIIVPIIYFFLKDRKSGAQTTIHLCVSDDVENVSGEYFVDCKPAWISSKAKDPVLAAKLWNKSEELTGIKYGI